METTIKQFRKRNAILACLRQSKQHPSADALFAQLKPEYPDLSLGTVYRNLTLFKQQGLVVSLGTVSGVEGFDGNPAPHVHFICTRCGCVQDLPGMQAPEALFSAAAANSGGQVDSCQLTFSGLCASCVAEPLKGGETT